ncbi:hypothetical protein FBU59_003803 [Linderina macrospora]|uniref:Uncharacterized protein n=1 Tax=Linderina macrospora TaxID=4868 RepID=A0ACC1J7J2_9FUNG|nr:hypothetical protein FBU59_003803 [Linderina macrospora]
MSYPRILPRGNPDEHRQAMAEEQEEQESQLISERRRRNTLAAARMRERQRQRERELIQRRNDLMGKVHQLEAELAAIREQRVASEGNYKLQSAQRGRMCTSFLSFMRPVKRAPSGWYWLPSLPLSICCSLLLMMGDDHP